MKAQVSRILTKTRTENRVEIALLVYESRIFAGMQYAAGLLWGRARRIVPFGEPLLETPA